MLDVMKCNVCGKIVMVIHNGVGTTVCCNQPMELQIEKADDQGKEKHLPVIEKTLNGIKVKVGSVPHPMEGDHYIEWIEVRSGDYLHVKGLQPGDAPEAEFPVISPDVKGRSYCNKHGLWSNKPKKQ
ncbi:MAG: desulfoferrodoxin [Methanomicrobiales archaeon]